MVLPEATDADAPLKKALAHSLALWAIVAPVCVLLIAAAHGQFALDFRHAFLPAAHAVLHGASPYSAVGSLRVAEGTAFLYPPLSAYLFAPFTLLPPVVAELVAVGLCAATVPLTLWILAVRDWRCYAVAFLWWPMIIGIGTANLTLPMMVGLALLWKYRERTWIAGVLTGFVVALKLFFWPMVLWLLATRRFGAAALAAGATFLFVFAPWAGIGFVGLRTYPQLLEGVSRSEGPRNYSLASLLHTVLPSWTVATGVETLLGFGILGLAVALGRRARDRDAFATAIVAILVLTPLLEMHYLATLLVVVALYTPEFNLAWVLPLLIWGAPGAGPGSTIQTVHVLAVAVATVVVACTGGTWEAPRALFRRPGGLAKWSSYPGREDAGSSIGS